MRIRAFQLMVVGCLALSGGFLLLVASANAATVVALKRGLTMSIVSSAAGSPLACQFSSRPSLDW